MKITIKHGSKTLINEYDNPIKIIDALQENNILISSPCGGNGKCGKCKVIIENNKTKKEVFACKTILTEDAIIYVNLLEGSGLLEMNLNSHFSKNLEEGFGIALDIGTTTLAFYLVDLNTANIIDKYSTLNPQKIYGADVVSRINACINGKLKELTKVIHNEIKNVLNYFIKKHSLSSIKKLIVTGNTTMLHLFIGEDVSSLGKAPFTPKFLNKIEKSGTEMNLDVEKVVLMPSFSSFVGADLVSGCLSTNILNENAILIDIGTNGEILLNYNNKLYSTSTAAGPAFEGNDIECGIGGVSGAISHAKMENKHFICETIDNASPIGICGSGLFDIVNIMIEENIIDETGAFSIENDKLYLTDNIYISQKDIRKFQLAKSAIRSGLDVLIKTAKAKYNDIEKVYIAGGLGFYISKSSAINLGLIPKQLENKIEVIGNSAGSGAIISLISDEAIKFADEIAKSATNVDLTNNSLFFEYFVDNMSFKNEQEE